MIEARGKSSALSAANSIANHLRDWLSCPPAADAAAVRDAGHWRAEPSARRQHAEGEDGDTAATAVAVAVAAGVSMGVFSDGNTYGVPDGLVCSFPVECGEGVSGLS